MPFLILIGSFMLNSKIKNINEIIILKQYLGGHIDLETFVILDKIFEFRSKFDKKLTDPVWETVSLKLRKYDPFININVFQYKKVLREVVNE